ncbi:MAG: RNA 2',3'-cyclic phosphodiesterase [Thermodesulfobacteriota bacterium]
MGIRSFLAFELPIEIKKVVAAVSEDLKTSSLKARWVKVENIHLTVVFLGHIAPEQLNPIQERTGTVCGRHPPFEIRLQGMGCFGSRRHPRVLWLGLTGDIKQMAIFKKDLQNTLEPLGIKMEKRPFRPHLTVGRFRKDAGPIRELDALLAKHEALTSPVCQLNELVLFRSDLRPNGAVYTQMAGWPLGSMGDL